MFDSDLTDGLSYGVSTCPSTPAPLTTGTGGMWEYMIKGFASSTDCNNPAVASTKFMAAYFRLAEAYAFSDAAARTTAASDACEASGNCATALPDRVEFCPRATAYLRIRGFWPCRTDAAYQIIKADGSTTSIVPLPSTGTSGNVNIDYDIPALGSAAELGLWQIRIGLLVNPTATELAFQPQYTVELDAFDVDVNNIIRAGKFYDANLNGMPDPGEDRIEGWEMTLSENAVDLAVEYTNANGVAIFDGLTYGPYTVTEGSLPNWIPTTETEQEVTFSTRACGVTENIRFGNVCIGGGTDAKSKGFWGNKNGMAIYTSLDVSNITTTFCLRNQDGTLFTTSSKTDFDKWLQKANSKNEAYMLSAQLAATVLNIGYMGVDISSLIYAPGTNAATTADMAGFATLGAVAQEAWNLLCSGGTDLDILLGHPDRARAAALSAALDGANTNQNYLQTTPCEINFLPNGQARVAATQPQAAESATLATYPNPLTDKTTISYTLAEAANVSLIVYDGFGRQVAVLHTGDKAAGTYNEEWEATNLAAGMYFCRLAITTENGAQSLQTTKMLLIK